MLLEEEKDKNYFSSKLERKIYKKIPTSKCLGCPSKGGASSNKVVAECCRKASPPLYLVEFLFFFEEFKKAKKELKNKILLNCFEAVLNKNTEKPCVILNQENNECSLYNARWTNCRTYGMISDKEWENRARKWIEIILQESFSEEVREKVIKKSKLGIDTEEEIIKKVINKKNLQEYIEDLFKDGFNSEKINQRLFEEKNITHFKVYEQCCNVKSDSPFKNIEKVFEDLVELEKEYKKEIYDYSSIDETYMSIHIHLLLVLVGQKKLDQLIQIRETFSEDFKTKFLKDIEKNIEALLSE